MSVAVATCPVPTQVALHPVFGPLCHFPLISDLGTDLRLSSQNEEGISKKMI